VKSRKIKKRRSRGARYIKAKDRAYTLSVQQQIDHWLSGFQLDEWIRDHVAIVIATLPPLVRDDLMGDPSFVLHDYDPTQRGTLIPVGIPLRGRPGRSVSLKRTLCRRPVDFVRWVIAHELAHAHLRNAGRWAHDDPETAADALAADWGFPKPLR
jgi:hypothetical protein